MFPWAVSQAIAFVFSSREESEGSDLLRALGIDNDADLNPSKTEERTQNVLQMMEGIWPTPIYLLSMSEGYLIKHIYLDQALATRAFHQQKGQDGVRELALEKYEDVPYEMVDDEDWLNGADDGYQVGKILQDYHSGTILEWNAYEDDFEDWPSDMQEERREEVYQEHKGPKIPKGTILYLAVEDPEDWLEEQKEQDEEGAGTNIVDPLISSSTPGDAPAWPDSAYEKKFLVKIELTEEIPASRNLAFRPSMGHDPWLATVIGVETLDPDRDEFDLDQICSQFQKCREADRRHWGPISLTIEKPDGSFFLVFWPYPQKNWLHNKAQAPIRVLEVTPLPSGQE